MFTIKKIHNKDNKVIEIMDQNEFKLLHKKHNDEMFNDSKKFSKVFNYVFIR